MKFKLKRSLGFQDNAPSPTDLEIESLVRLLREAMGGGVYEDFAATLRAIVLHRDEIQKSFLASIKLVGVLTHAAERRDPRSGRGSFKKEQVKAAISYLFKADKFDLPDVPPYLRPYVIDIVVDWSIEFVVVISNEHELWEPGEERVRTSIRAAIGRALCWLAKVTEPIWGRIVEFFAMLWEALQERTVITPELQKALDNAVRAGLVKDMRAWVGRAPELVAWVGKHQDQVTAGFQLVSEAVQITETLFASSKSGSEKKAYARDLIMSTLRELGSPLGSGLFGLIAEGIIDSLIDAAVKLFNNFPETKPAFEHG
jgi:hypothetical protein